MSARRCAVALGLIALLGAGAPAGRCDPAPRWSADLSSQGDRVRGEAALRVGPVTAGSGGIARAARDGRVLGQAMPLGFVRARRGAWSLGMEWLDLPERRVVGAPIVPPGDDSLPAPPPVPGPVTTRVPNRILLTARLDVGRFSAEVRTFTAQPVEPGLIPAQALVTWWLGRAGLTAGLGRAPVSRVAGFEPQGFVGLGLALGPRLRARPVAAADAIPGLRVRAGDGGTLELTAEVGDAHTVEVASDATSWTPVALTRVTGRRWTGRLPATGGVQRVVIRVDGGPWRPPRGLPRARDPLLGEVGLILPS